MSGRSQNYSDENALIDCAQRFFSKYHVDRLLVKCNRMKEKVFYLFLSSATNSTTFWRKKYVYAATHRLL